MRRVLEIGAGILAAFLLLTLLVRIHPLAGEIFNPFVVAVLLIGLLRGEAAGAVAGAVAGLVADTFSLGLFGIAGIALTTTGFLAGFISRKINVLAVTRLLVFFVLLAAAELALWAGLTVLVFGRPGPWSGGLLLVQPAVNAVVAASVEKLIRKVKIRHER